MCVFAAAESMRNMRVAECGNSHADGSCCCNGEGCRQLGGGCLNWPHKPQHLLSSGKQFCCCYSCCRCSAAATVLLPTRQRYSVVHRGKCFQGARYMTLGSYSACVGAECLSSCTSLVTTAAAHANMFKLATAVAMPCQCGPCLVWCFTTACWPGECGQHVLLQCTSTLLHHCCCLTNCVCNAAGQVNAASMYYCTEGGRSCSTGYDIQENLHEVVSPMQLLQPTLPCHGIFREDTYSIASTFQGSIINALAGSCVETVQMRASDDGGSSCSNCRTSCE